MTRRTFVQFLATLSAAQGLGVLQGPASCSARSTRFRYVAAAENAIHVFRSNTRNDWSIVQVASSPSPASILLAPDQRTLYVANAVDNFEHRPSGSVQVFSIDSRSGTLTCLQRQSLALFTTRPSQLAISPNGRNLAVAAAYGTVNLLPIHKDGTVGHVTACMKRLSINNIPSRDQPTYQHNLQFLDNGTILTAEPYSHRTIALLVAKDGSLSFSAHEPILLARRNEDPDDLGGACSSDQYPAKGDHTKEAYEAGYARRPCYRS
jgi:6-phosphogluconolactonase (cycloisomerase 2 family)